MLFRRLGLATLILAVLTVLFSYPAIFHLSTHLICTHPDGWQYPWAIFNFREQVLQGKDPLFTDYMFHPIGTSLTLHSYTEFNGAAAFLLSPFFNDIALTNLMGILSTLISGIGMYILARELTQNSMAALFAAIAFAFTPFRMNRMTYQMHMALTQWIPFALWAFLKTAEDLKLRYSLLTGVFFSLTYYCNPYFAIYLGIAFLLMLPLGLLLFPAWRKLLFWKHLVLAGVVAFVILIPPILRFYRDYKEGTVHSYEHVKRNAATVSEYLRRGCMNRYLNDLFGQSHLNKLLGSVTTPGSYTDIMPGWVVVFLGLGGIFCAVLYRQRKFLMFTLVGLVFFLLSLGPEISVLSMRWKMPFYWFTKVPYANHARTPERFAIMVTLLLILTAAYLLSLFFRKYTGAPRNLLAGVLLAALLLELAPLPVPLERFDPPEMFQSLGKTRGDVLLTVPYTLGGTVGSYYLAFQTVHRKAALDGRISRNPRHVIGYLRNLPITGSLDYLTRTGQIRNNNEDAGLAPLFRRFFGVHYLALFPRYSRPGIRRFVQTLFPDAKLVDHQKGIELYELPPVRQDTFEFKKGDRGLAFFLLSDWEVSHSGKESRVVCRGERARLLLPVIKRGESAQLELELSSAEPQAKLRCVVANRAIQETQSSSGMSHFSCNIPGDLLLNAHRTVSIELARGAQTDVDHQTGFELNSLRLQIR